MPESVKAFRTDVGVRHSDEFAELASAEGRSRSVAAVVEPAYLLAYIGDSQRGESEFVVDPRGLSDENVRAVS